MWRMARHSASKIGIKSDILCRVEHRTRLLFLTTFVSNLDALWKGPGLKSVGWNIAPSYQGSSYRRTFALRVAPGFNMEENSKLQPFEGVGMGDTYIIAWLGDSNPQCISNFVPT